MMDETIDVSNTSQLALVLHYVTDTSVKNRIVRFEEITSAIERLTLLLLLYGI